jgi:hypothetical protein
MTGFHNQNANGQSANPQFSRGRKDQIDRILIGACILALLVGGYILLDGRLFENSESQKNRTPVGKFSNYNNDVRKKSVSAISWQNVHASEAVYEGDSVFTGDGSEAQIEIGAGHLTVKEKSLVVVTTHKGHLEVNLAYGGFSSQLAADQTITVIDNGHKSEISGSRGEVVEIVHSQDKKAKIQVIKSIALTSPEQAHQFWNGDQTAIHFSWTPVAGISQYTFELASDSGFSNSITKKTLAESSLDLPQVDTQSTKLYWRVKSAAGSEQAKSAVRHLTVLADNPPDLILPKDKQVTLIDTQAEKKTPIGFRWQDRAGSQDFNLQIAKDADFKELIVEQKTQAHAFETDQLLPGEYFWRVSSSHPKRKATYLSQVRNLSVVDTIHPLPPVNLKKAELHYILPRIYATKTSETYAKYNKPGVPSKDSPALTWDPLDKAAEYRLDISLRQDFLTVQTTDWQKPTAYHFANLKPGAIYWRVQARDAQTTLGKISPSGKLQVDLPSPEPTGSIVDATPNAKTMQVKTSWNPLLFATSYELQVSDNEQMKKAKKVFLQTSQATVDFPQSNAYLWRVRALNEKHEPISEFSKISKAELRPPPPPIAAQPPEETRAPAAKDPNAGASSQMPVPILHEPLPDSHLVTFGQSPVFVTLKWKPINGVTKYRVQISDSADFSHEIANQTTRSPRLLLNSQLPQGQLFWRVRSENTDQLFSIWSAPYQFAVQFK